LFYGFVLPDNPFDSIQIFIDSEAREEELSLEIKKTILAQCSKDWFSLEYEIKKN